MIRASLRPSGTRLKDWHITGHSTLGELARPAPRPPRPAREPDAPVDFELAI